LHIKRLSGPELYVLQIHRGGLDPDDCEHWLGDLLVAARSTLTGEHLAAYVGA